MASGFLWAYLISGFSQLIDRTKLVRTVEEPKVCSQDNSTGNQ
jgi:hypothetical protein